MRRISAHYVLTNTGTPLKKAVIHTDDDGTIIRIENGSNLSSESYGIEFYNGIIIPGFVNCHCHLELSHLKGIIPQKTGLEKFLIHIRDTRTCDSAIESASAAKANHLMADEGIVACADICNKPVTFYLKKESSVYYHNLLEVFGTDPEKAKNKIGEISAVAEEARKSGLSYSLVPHTVYSVSLPLFRLLKEETKNNRVTSIHFMEAEGEARLLKDQTGPISDSFKASGLMPDATMLPASHVTAILDEVTPSGNLILVHNTCADAETVRQVKRRGNTFWCLCPRSNMYIENRMPPAEMLLEEECDIVVGTDSLASNTTLSILSELKLIQQECPGIALEELIKWSTINGARALCIDHIYGKIEPGKRPGLLLLENTDLVNFKLLPETIVRRLL